MVAQEIITQQDSFSLLCVSNYYYFFYGCVDKRLPYSTGVKVKEQLLPKEVKRLEDMAAAIREYITFYDFHGKDILHDELKSYLNDKFKAPKEQKPVVLKIMTNDFVTDHKKWINDMREGKITKKDGVLHSKNTIDQYERMRKKWESCADETKSNNESRFHLTYDMTIDDCRKLLVWLNKKNHSRNAIYDIFNNLKIFLKWSHNSGLHSNELYKTMQNSLNVRPELADAIAPSYDEIYALYKRHFENLNEERARDFFVLGCFLGLRVNDLLRINEYQLLKHPDGYYYFEVFAQKTTTTLSIPAHWIAIEIYNKYRRGIGFGSKYGPFEESRVPKQWRRLYVAGELPVFRKNNLAQYLPKICKKDITGKKLIAMTRGGVKQVHHYERWDLVTPHTMRRFFATFMYCDMGLSAAEVMQFTGHKTEGSFFRYIKIDRARTVKKVATLAAFVGPDESSSGLSVVA